VTSVLNQNESCADGVVLLHGIARSARSLRRMQAALETAGFATLNLALRLSPQRSGQARLVSEDHDHDPASGQAEDRRQPAR